MRFVSIALVSLISLILTAASGHADNHDQVKSPLIPAKQFVVMIDGRFPTRDVLTTGAGLVVGRKDGQVYVVTAGHVVRNLRESARDIKIQFSNNPGEEIAATLWPTEFDKGVDLAVLIVPEASVPKSIVSLKSLPVARLSDEVEIGEGAFLLGQPGGNNWSGNKSPEKITSVTSTAIEVESPSVVPGMSGGATFDEGLRIIGLIVEAENGLARAIPLKFLKETLEQNGYPFELVDADGQAPEVIVQQGSEKDRLAIALSSGQFEELALFPRSQKIALLTESILTADESVRKLFFSRLRDEGALNWFRDIIARGLNPNFIADNGGRRSALYYALINSNIDLGILLLEEGASPHAYQSLWGNESKSVSLLKPLDWLKHISASNEQKRRLIMTMAESGLALIVRDPSGQYSFEDSEIQNNLTLLERLGIKPEQVDAFVRDNKRCQLFDRGSDIDWCAEAKEVPTFIENIAGGGDDLFEGFLIGKFIGVYQNRMYFFALGANGDWSGYPPGIAVVSRGRDSVQLYRYSRNGAGLGHCSRLRDRAAGREVGDFKDSDNNAYCWRRETLSRSFLQPGYDSWWEQSYYCRNGAIENSTIKTVRDKGSTWSEVDLDVRMRGRVPC